MARPKSLTLLLAVSLAWSLVACSNEQNQPVEESPAAAEATPAQTYDLHAAPEDVKWQTGPAGLDFPVSEVSGPMTINPVPSGFSEDPQGAVLSAIAGQVFMSGADDELWPEVSQTLLEPGPGRDQWAQYRALVTVDGTVADPPVFVGFQVADFADDASEAVITLAVEYPDGLIGALPVQMSRSSGDWRTVLPPQDQAPDLTEISSDDLDTTFTRFSPKEAQ